MDTGRETENITDAERLAMLRDARPVYERHRKAARLRAKSAERLVMFMARRDAGGVEGLAEFDEGGVV